jgi:hypothetical protein
MAGSLRESGPGAGVGRGEHEQAALKSLDRKALGALSRSLDARVRKAALSHPDPTAPPLGGAG